MIYKLKYPSLDADRFYRFIINQNDEVMQWCICPMCHQTMEEAFPSNKKKSDLILIEQKKKEYVRGM